MSRAVINDGNGLHTFTRVALIRCARRQISGDFE